MVQQVIEEVKSYCEKNKLRLTKDRQKVLEIIIANTPIKAYDILDELKIDKKGAAPPTVYRALEFLEKHDFVHKINTTNSYIFCEHYAEHASYQIFICKDCHKTYVYCDNRITCDILNLSKEKNFLPQKVAVEVLGICKNCH